jgi:hypothetical protein
MKGRAELRKREGKSVMYRERKCENMSCHILKGHFILSYFIRESGHRVNF